MSKFQLLLLLLLAWAFRFPILFAQADTLLFTQVSEYPFPAPYTCYTARFDVLHRPYIYTANQEYGLIIFDYSDVQNPQPVRSFSVQDFKGLRPTDLVQQGNYLYVSLGGFAGLFPQNAGMAVLLISDPANAVLLGQWSDPAFNKGCAAVRVAGNTAYLGAMDKGVILLNISNPAAPKYLSHVELDIGWPIPPGLFSVPHARGLALRGDELWTCFDAGGLRLVNVFDKQNPFEAFQYVNDDLFIAAQPAYNNAVVVDDYLYVTVDFCGIDIVDISDPAKPVNAGWENPWNCNKQNWNGRPGHTNQIATACNNRLLFVSGGDSEVLAYSILNRTQPRRVGRLANLQDSVATWGIDVNDSLVVLAQIWNPANFPYVAKNGGIRLLRWTCPQTIAVPAVETRELHLMIRPNPVREQMQVQFNLPAAGELHWSLVDLLGRRVQSGLTGRLPAGDQLLDLDLGGLPAGVYAFLLLGEGPLGRGLLVKAY